MFSPNCVASQNPRGYAVLSSTTSDEKGGGERGSSSESRTIEIAFDLIQVLIGSSRNCRYERRKQRTSGWSYGGRIKLQERYFVEAVADDDAVIDAPGKCFGKYAGVRLWICLALYKYFCLNDFLLTPLLCAHSIRHYRNVCRTAFCVT